MLNLDEKNKKLMMQLKFNVKLKENSIGGISKNNLHLKEQRKNFRNPIPKKFIISKKIE